MSRKTLAILFLTLFLDLVGFSLIFPLFPQLIDYYLTHNANDFFLKIILQFISAFQNFSKGSPIATVVLFGGILGALYSLLQFLFAPFWGSLSDRVGRKPVLVISLFGIMASYALWIFSGSFTLLILARLLAGLMGGNISVATAVVGDITDAKNRSKGMAIIGMAFGLGFIFGPALGGLFSLIHFEEIFPQMIILGINPFSAVALFGFLLALINLLLIIFSFKETLAPQNRTKRTANPFKLFAPLPYRGVNQTNFINFFFLIAFSGMEFTLTFLAVERLAFTPLENAWMFVFVGVLIALTQGGFVRKKAHDIGEKNLAFLGLLLIMPGFILLAQTHTIFWLYSGLFLMAIGSAMIIPCLAALVSLFSPANAQGQAIGIFRSLGALARVIGPLAACLVYWRFGSTFAYLSGAFLILIPSFLVLSLKQKLPLPPLAKRG